MKTEECTAVSTYKKGFCGHSQARRLWRALFRLLDARLRLHIRNSRRLSDVWQYVTRFLAALGPSNLYDKRHHSRS